MRKFKEWALENKITLIKLIICFIGLVVTTRYVNYLAIKAEKAIDSEKNILGELRSSETYTFNCTEGDLVFDGTYKENVTTLKYKENNYYIADNVLYNENATISEENINYISPFDIYELTSRGNYITTLNNGEYKVDFYTISKEKYNHYFDSEKRTENSNISVAYNDENIKLTVDNLVCIYTK